MYEDIPAKDNIIKKLLDFNKHSQFGTMTIDQTQNYFEREIISALKSAKYIQKKKNTEEYFITEKGYSMLQRWYALEATRKLKKTLENTNNAIKSSIQKLDESSTKINKQMLSQSKDALNINKQMLKHTKTMKRMTGAILLFTIANLIFIIVQIILIIKN